MAQHALEFSIRWTVETCCECGIAFAVPTSLWQQWKGDSSKWFYCPNGHQQHYTEGDVQRERRLREQAEARAKREQKRREWAQQEARQADYRARAAKGQLTKARKRIAAGICPCCNRQFENVMLHMRHKHPEFAAEVAESKSED